MKTYPTMRSNGSIQHFEIPNAWISLRSIQQLLQSINGVSSIKFGLGLERLTFQYHDELCVVYDPKYDADGGPYYRISPKLLSDSELDLSKIHSVFANHRGILSQLWFEFRNKEVRQ